MEEKTIYISTRKDENKKWVIVLKESVVGEKEENPKVTEYKLDESGDAIPLILAKIKVDYSFTSVIIDNDIFGSRVIANKVASAIPKYLVKYKDEILGQRESEVYFDEESKKYVILLEQI